MKKLITRITASLGYLLGALGVMLATPALILILVADSILEWIEKKNVRNYRKDAPGAVSGINTPDIELPAYNPPVPNRAWTAMRKGLDIDELSEEEKRSMYLGRDNFF